MNADLNLLRTLDVLLSEGSVAGAARRLRLSASAMSRTLARLRDVTGDQLLVRAGRGLVPTSRADAIRSDVRKIVEDAEALLRPVAGLNLSKLDRVFTIRASDGFAESFGPSLIAGIHDEAPGVKLRFVRKLDKDSGGLRDGTVDLETGVIAGPIGPEVRAQALFTDRYVAVVRSGHPIAFREATPEDFAAWPHVVTWRPGLDLGDIDQLLSAQGLERHIMTTVDGFSSALSLARGSDLIATVPERHTLALRSDMHSFAIPLAMMEFTISLLWHPRLDGDPAHRWLREAVRHACREGVSKTGAASGPLPTSPAGI